MASFFSIFGSKDGKQQEQHQFDIVVDSVSGELFQPGKHFLIGWRKRGKEREGTSPQFYCFTARQLETNFPITVRTTLEKAGSGAFRDKYVEILLLQKEVEVARFAVNLAGHADRPKQAITLNSSLNNLTMKAQISSVVDILSGTASPLMITPVASELTVVPSTHSYGGTDGGEASPMSQASPTHAGPTHQRRSSEGFVIRNTPIKGRKASGTGGQNDMRITPVSSYASAGGSSASPIHGQASPTNDFGGAARRTSAVDPPPMGVPVPSAGASLPNPAMEDLGAGSPLVGTRSLISEDTHGSGSQSSQHRPSIDIERWRRESACDHEPPSPVQEASPLGPASPSAASPSWTDEAGAPPIGLRLRGDSIGNSADSGAPAAGPSPGTVGSRQNSISTKRRQSLAHLARKESQDPTTDVIPTSSSVPRPAPRTSISATPSYPPPNRPIVGAGGYREGWHNHEASSSGAASPLPAGAAPAAEASPSASEGELTRKPSVRWNLGPQSSSAASPKANEAPDDLTRQGSGSQRRASTGRSSISGGLEELRVRRMSSSQGGNLSAAVARDLQVHSKPKDEDDGDALYPTFTWTKFPFGAPPPEEGEENNGHLSPTSPGSSNAERLSPTASFHSRPRSSLPTSAQAQTANDSSMTSPPAKIGKPNLRPSLKGKEREDASPTSLTRTSAASPSATSSSCRVAAADQNELYSTLTFSKLPPLPAAPLGSGVPILSGSQKIYDF